MQKCEMRLYTLQTYLVRIWSYSTRGVELGIRGVGSNHILGGPEVNRKSTTENILQQLGGRNCPPRSYTPGMHMQIG